MREISAVMNILDLLEKAEGRTLPFSVLLPTTLSRRELISLLNSLEQADLVSHTTDFWGDPKSYTLLVGWDELLKRDVFAVNGL
jgi:hypothetical protein